MLDGMDAAPRALLVTVDENPGEPNPASDMGGRKHLNRAAPLFLMRRRRCHGGEARDRGAVRKMVLSVVSKGRNRQS